MLKAVVVVMYALTLAWAVLTVIANPSAFKSRLAVLGSYIAFVAVLVALALIADMSGGIAFALFIVASGAFSFGYIRLGPWQCWVCCAVNPPGRDSCSGCGRTRNEIAEMEGLLMDEVIIVSTDDGLRFFSSADRALEWLDSDDFSDGRYGEAWAGNGTSIELSVFWLGRLRGEHVRLVPGGNSAEALRIELIEFLGSKTAAVRKNLEVEPLGQLLQDAIDIAGLDRHDYM